jgi:ABC-type lipoprotein export system ATPase subunit
MVVTHDQSLSERTERILHLLDGRLDRDVNNGNGKYLAKGAMEESHEYDLAQSLA